MTAGTWCPRGAQEGGTDDRTGDDRRAAPVEHGVHVAVTPPAVPGGVRGAGGPVRPGRLPRARGRPRPRPPGPGDGGGRQGRGAGRRLPAHPGGRALTFATHLVARSPLRRSLAHHPVLGGRCADLVGPDVNLYWDQAVYKKPEKPRRFPWHQDNGYCYVEPQLYLTCWLALTDATVENGCPQVVPGVHRVGTIRHRFVDPLGFECF